ncbi:hypothetical protein QFC22_002180 [Naganishia vaughanmartiniae]|uniref:Uncharacterized protein n=1 Tax=Naganishia vaughanmartiniae TaxID=1424756 RepID=A0ACC2XDV0_9TREE|nr:hypothetical protein QFC22_002180 [Naganishia vaughanmartiniae]
MATKCVRSTTLLARHGVAATRSNRLNIRHVTSDAKDTLSATGSATIPTTTASSSSSKSVLNTSPNTAASIPKIKPVQNNPKAGNWPWKTVEFDQANGKTTEERLIYARPPSFRPKMLWFVIAAWIPASALMADNLIRGYENEEYEAKEEAILEASKQQLPPAVSANNAVAATPSPSSAEPRVNEDPHPDLLDESTTIHTSQKANSLVPFFTNGQLAATAIVLAGSFMTFVSLAYPTRVITRLAQVRTKTSQHEPWTYSIQMETASNQMWTGSWKRARLVEPERMDVGLIRRGTVESPFLRVKIQPSKRDRVIGDAYTYRLDFTKLGKGDHGVPIKKEERDESSVSKKPRPQEEVVISLRRIEEVFGSLG